MFVHSQQWLYVMTLQLATGAIGVVEVSLVRGRGRPRCRGRLKIKVVRQTCGKVTWLPTPLRTPRACLSCLSRAQIFATVCPPRPIRRGQPVNRP
ncbi:unnamed protein product [Arctia plantaginis]|uniref:Uncharacterized protein n=1 Tax=Arctia plantaginis TaxID=874455 RepID=A0A8S0YWJ9_ARCPL|nr:unnamed protein product [Arctia plantaginis]CAB3242280.1 unnamed protein product [Arctia plantaginis]